MSEPAAAPACDRCGGPLEAEHEHLLDPDRRALACACGVCAVMAAAVRGAPWKRVRPCAVPLPDLSLTDELWARLELPIGLAFFVRSSVRGRVVAWYPGAAGLVESELPLAAWETLAAADPRVAGLEPDVEAILVHRARGAREHWRVSIDECFRLAGLIRLRWRGYTGGPAVWRAVEGFFAGLGGRP